MRQLHSRPILDKLRDYLLEIQTEVLPKSPEGRAVRYTLKNSTALTRYCEDGDLEIDNNATERSDPRGSCAPQLRNAMCERRARVGGK